VGKHGVQRPGVCPVQLAAALQSQRGGQGSTMSSANGTSDAGNCYARNTGK
jgi:hypothetical protein